MKKGFTRTIFAEQNLRGFTIVEMIVYMALLTVMLVILTRMFTGILDMQLKSTAVGEVEEDSRYVFTRLAYDIGRASGIVTPANLGEQTNTLTLLIDGTAYAYNLSNFNLLLGSDQLNSAGTAISNLSFLRLGESIQIGFTIASTTQTVPLLPSKTLKTTIALR